MALAGTIGALPFQNRDLTDTSGSFGWTYNGDSGGSGSFTSSSAGTTQTSHVISLDTHMSGIDPTLTDADTGAPTITNLQIEINCCLGGGQTATVYVQAGSSGNTKNSAEVFSNDIYGDANVASFSGDLTYWGLTQTQAFEMLNGTDTWNVWIVTGGTVTAEFNLKSIRCTVSISCDDTGWTAVGPYGFGDASDQGSSWAFESNILTDNASYARASQNNSTTTTDLTLTQWDVPAGTTGIPDDAIIKAVKIRMDADDDGTDTHLAYIDLKAVSPTCIVSLPNGLGGTNGSTGEYLYPIEGWLTDSWTAGLNADIRSAIKETAAASGFGPSDHVIDIECFDINSTTYNNNIYYIEMTVYYTLPQPGGVMLGSFH